MIHFVADLMTIPNWRLLYATASCLGAGLALLVLVQSLVSDYCFGYLQIGE